MRRTLAARRSRAAGWARLAGGLSVPVLIIGALGSRAGMVPGAALLPVLIVGFALALAAGALAIYALVDIWHSGADGAGAAIAGLVYALPALAALSLVAGAAVYYPRVTDVVTDPEDPPAFTTSDAPHVPPDADSLARQEAAFPDLVTRTYPMPLSEVYAAARDLVNKRGWVLITDPRPSFSISVPSGTEAAPEPEDDELARVLASKSVMTQSRGGAVAAARAADSAEDVEPYTPTNTVTLEAIASTPVFAFPDDIAVRLESTSDGTRLDMRSASRFGEHDLGENARRIRGFLADLDKTLQPETIAPPGVALAQ